MVLKWFPMFDSWLLVFTLLCNFSTCMWTAPSDFLLRNRTWQKVISEIRLSKPGSVSTSLLLTSFFGWLWWSQPPCCELPERETQVAKNLDSQSNSSQKTKSCKPPPSKPARRPHTVEPRHKCCLYGHFNCSLVREPNLEDPTNILQIPDPQKLWDNVCVF